MICYENLMKNVVHMTLFFFHNTFIFVVVGPSMIFLLFYFDL